MPPIPIDGIQTGNTKPWPVPDPMPLRREIDDWFDNEPDQVNLFFQAFTKFQNVPQDEQLSYFKVAGIHFFPLYDWTGDDNDTHSEKPLEYCAHGNIKFGTWHRPYLSLFESLVQKHMFEIAAQYGDAADREKYQKAATEWRLPFWDYGLKKERNGELTLAIPKLLEEEYRQVPVYLPSGQTSTIANPFQAYNFRPTKPNDPEQIIPVGEPLQSCEQTLRYPRRWNPNNQSIVQEFRKGVQRNSRIASAINNADPALSQRIYQIMALDKFIEFGPSIWNSGAPPSLEDVHNTMHVLIGGSLGHMTNPAYASFDPVFWLHHCNVDRLLAIWQELNEDSWWTEDDRSGESITPETPLEPFYRTEGSNGTTQWDSNAARYHYTFGYSYPTLEPWKEEYNSSGTFDRVTYKSDIRYVIARDYGQVQRALWSRKGLDIGKPSSAAALVVQPQADIAAVASISGSDAAPAPSALPSEIQFDDYVTNIHFEKYAYQNGEGFNVHVFLGPFDKDASAAPEWAFEQSLVGTVSNFSTSQGVTGATACTNCLAQQRSRLVVGGQITLTNAILNAVARGDISSRKNREEITEYLKKHLTWRVASTGGNDIPREIADLESLEVRVERAVAKTPNEDGKFTEYGVYEPLYEVTQDKARGAKPPTST